MNAFTILKKCSWLAEVPEATLAVWEALGRWLRLEPNDVLFKADSPLQFVYIVASGRLRVESTQTIPAIQEAQAGDLLDPVAVFMATTYETTVSCLEAAQVWYLPASVWHGLARSHPELWVRLLDQLRDQILSHSLRRALHQALPTSDASALVRLAFDEGRWWHMARGEPLFQAGEAFDAWYVLVSGQLAEFYDDERPDATTSTAFTHPDVLLHPGDLVGDGAALMGTAYSSSVFAMRDAWLMRLEPHEFEALVLQQPATVQQVARRALQRNEKKRHTTQKNNITLTLVASPSLEDSAALILAIYQGILHFQPVVLLNADLCESWGIVPHVRQRQRADLEWLRLDAWVQHQHEKGKLVLLVADPQQAMWSAQVARLADRVLFLADAQKPVTQPLADLWPPKNDPAAPPSHQAQAQYAWDLQCWLCLVHPAHADKPTGTRAWLTHLQPQKHFHLRRHHTQDLGRLVRHLTHQAIGLALSGGGGRGPTHAGVFRALEQARIPIDCVVGASAGASMGCLLAQDQGWQYCAEQAMRGIGSAPGPFGDLTLPIVSIVKSQRLYEAVRRTFPEMHLEDAWIPCFVVATNLTRMRKTVFSQGEVWEAALASASPPGVAKPRIINGELLCDGGLIENLPVSVLVEENCRYIITSNIATQLNLTLDTPDFPNPWAILLDRLLHQGQATADVPSAIDILLAATTLASEDNRQAMSHHIDMAFTPHLKRFKSTDFTQSQALIAQGFADTKTQIADHQRSGHSPELWSVIYKSHTLSWHNDFPQSPALVSPTSTPPPTAV